MGCCARFCRSPDPFCESKPAFSGLFRDDRSTPGLGVGRGDPCAAPVRGSVSASRKSGTFQNMQRVFRTPASQSSSHSTYSGREKPESLPRSRASVRTRQVQRWAWFPAQSWPWGLPSDLLKHHRALLCYVSKAAAPLGDRCPRGCCPVRAGPPPARAPRRSSCYEVPLHPTR